MAENLPCRICRNEQARTVVEAEDFGGPIRIRQHCPLCGEFRLEVRDFSTHPIPQETQVNQQETQVKLSAWIREQNLIREIPTIDVEQFQRIAAMPIPSPLERADRILIHAVRCQKSLDEIIPCYQPEFQAISHSQNLNELSYLLKSFLVDQGLLEYISHKGGYKVTPQGHKRYEELYTREAASTQAFVAMWFDDSMQDAYKNGLEVGIQKAGYDPVRIDGVEHAGKIDDRIIAEIRRSKFLVADFTGQRGGVYFEAGFALGLNLPVIWTCRKDEIKKLHFDIRQYNCIDWTEPSELAERLKNRIGAIIGMGPRQFSNQE